MNKLENCYILGIDPGTINCGFAVLYVNRGEKVLKEAGVIKIKSKVLQEQILELSTALDILFEKYRFSKVAVEDIFFAFNPKTVLKLAQFRGALSLIILQKFGIFSEYTPLQIKKTVTGKAKATKEQVNYMVKTILNIKKPIKPLDVSDAIAIALTEYQHKGI
ncbi:MAG: crossover junction endodeoxyribonuclease RuvC [Campylobacteraceae bacterium 4484_166]|nr:MAG: crossover junction endodeoxyribonuclease RuvC [Campylobacteraceae bacterium 4484_166]